MADSAFIAGCLPAQSYDLVNNFALRLCQVFTAARLFQFKMSAFHVTVKQK